MGNRFLPLYKAYTKDLKSINHQQGVTKKPENKKTTPSKGDDINVQVPLTKNNWFSGKNAVDLIFDKSSLHINHTHIDSEFFYISYQEKSLDFSISASHTDLSLQTDKNYLVNFLGSTSKGVRVELFVIYYKEKQRISFENVLLNSSRILKNKGEFDDIRIAIRIAGKGETCINQIQLICLEAMNQAGTTNVDNTIKKEDYIWKSVKEISHFHAHEWFSKEKDHIRKMEFTDSLKIEVDYPDKSFTYFSYLEENVDFKRPPRKQQAEFSPNYIYDVQFQGTKKDSVTVELFLVFYSKGKKEQIETLLLNETRCIKVKNNIDQYRMAMKLSGKGRADVTSIKIRKRRELPTLPFFQLRQLGFDVPSTIKDTKIAAICDDFTTVCLNPECQMITFGPDDWKPTLEINKPHLLFVESAWHGNDGRWTRKVSYRNDNNTLQLQELVAWCKANHIPTVFWNKEDPVHFNSFIKTAQYFDYIFTTDQNSIENYRKHTNKDNVYALPFAAQPIVHNPIQLYERKTKACFAGSYYATKYVERQKDMNLLLESAARYGLDIYDRNHGKDLTEFYFPEHLRKYIVGSLKTSEISKAYKGYRVALNVNSVIDSPTMFSRRVFECLASNTPVVSTYSAGISNMLGDAVLMAKEESALNQLFAQLMNDEQYYKKQAHLGYRKVMLHHTYEERLKFVLEKAGIKINQDPLQVSVVSKVSTAIELENVIRMFTQQSHPEKNLTVIVPPALKNATEGREIRLFTAQEFTKEFQLGDSSYLAYFSPKNEYGENYLQDLLLARKYAQSEVTGKKAFYSMNGDQIVMNHEDSEHIYVDSLTMDAAILHRQALQTITNDRLLTLMEGNQNLHFLFKQGIRMYSADSYNFLKGTSRTSISHTAITNLLI